MTMTSNKPYFIRAIYDWISDNGMTPYVLVDAAYPDATLPQMYVERGRIILDISQEACRELSIENDFISFLARFAGKSMETSFRTASVLAIYAKENGRGMEFGPEYDEPYPPETPHAHAIKQKKDTAKTKSKPALTLIKNNDE